MRSVTTLRMPFMLLITVCVLSCARTPDAAPSERADRIHEEAVVIDAHAHPKPGAAETLSLGEKTAGFEVDFVTMKEGGLDAVFFSLPMLTSESDERPESVRIVEDARAVAEEVGRFEDLAEIAHSSEDISRIHSLGKRAVARKGASQSKRGWHTGGSFHRLSTVRTKSKEGREMEPSCGGGTCPRILNDLSLKQRHARREKTSPKAEGLNTSCCGFSLSRRSALTGWRYLNHLYPVVDIR